MLKAEVCRRLLKACAGLPLVFSLLTANASADELNQKSEFNIPAQSLNAALVNFSEQANLQLIVNTKILEGFTTSGVNGELAAQVALVQLLDGTGLGFKSSGAGTVVVSKLSQDELDVSGSKIKNIENNQSIEEIIVTAQKRETRLQDTAIAISTLSADTIEKRGLDSMGDYLSTIPGVTIQDRGAGANSITMRGISAGPQTERTAVGVYFGESSISGMSNGPNTVSSDPRMVDIERVEVLKGPQGTLYGADSMGGIVRIIPKAPNLEQLEGAVGVQYSTTGELGGNNHQIQGVFNLPLIESQLALRGVAYRFENSGYVENIAGSYTGDATPIADLIAKYGGVAVDDDEVGSDETTGLRLAALWQPIDTLSIKLSHTWQEITQDGSRDTYLGLPGKFQQIKVQPWPNSTIGTTGNGIAPEPEGMNEEVNITSLVLDYDLGWGTLHSTSSWIDRESTQFWDISQQDYGLTVMQVRADEADRFTQELRFTSQFEGPVQLLAGLYYDDYENNYNLSSFWPGDPANAGAVNADTGRNLWAGHEDEPYYSLGHYQNSLEQKAVFAEVSYDIIDRLTATLGARHYEYEQSTWAERAGYWYRSETFGSPGTTTSDKADDSGETYRVNLSWKPSDDTLLYAQWAEGFRLANIQRPLAESKGCDIDGNGRYEVSGGGEVPIVDGLLEPDTTENYELGFKGTFADNLVSLDVALYHIDWEGLPVRVILEKSGCGGYRANAGFSTSEGIEVESRLRLTDALRLDLGASYNEAKLSKDQSGLGEKGDDLPGSADINFSAGLEYGFSLAGYDAFARVDYAYVGEYGTRLDQPDDLPSSGGFSQIHLKTGITLDKLAVDLFVKNLTNADDLTWVEDVSTILGTTTVFRLRPRTIGLNLHYSF